MRPNNAYLLRLWVFPVVLIGLMTSVAIYQLAHGEYFAVEALAPGVVFAGIVVLYARHKRAALFLEPNPDRAISFYHSTMKRIADGGALMAFNSAYAAVLYGQYDRAREELCTVNWGSLPPIYQGYETYIHALLALFQKRNIRDALELATEAKELCTANSRIPGVKTSMLAYNATIGSCLLLRGNSSSNVVSELDLAMRKLPGVSRAIHAWATAVHLRRLGQMEEAAKYEQIVDRLAPYCVPLHEFDFVAII